MTQAAPSNWRRSCALAAGALLLVGALGVGGGWWWWTKRDEVALEAQEARAKDEFAPAQEKLDEAIAQNRSEPVDIDKTIRVVHEIDLAMRNTSTLKEYLSWMARQDYRGVAPEVLKARRELLDVLFALYAKQTEEADQAAMWAVSTETLLEMASMVSVDVELSAVPTSNDARMKLDREQAQTLLRQIEERREVRAKLKGDIRELEGQLLEHMLAYSETYYGYVEEWDRLCVLRDRAYLASSRRDWPAAYAAAKQAAELAPMEREAHLLMALALLEGGQVLDPEGPPVETILGRYIDEHPDASAPALLLLGVAEARVDRIPQAQLDLQQAAAYYPRQSERLTDLLDPYRSRSYLRKSREGTYIVQLYQATMDGAGYFSPDLQLARIHFDRGEDDQGRAKVLDHFQRRRTQAEWGFILDDLRFAEQFLGEDFVEMLPEASFLDLQVSPTLIGQRLSLTVQNRSDRTLHNATLLLCLHMTDMHPGDYEVVKAGDTQPAVNAHDSTSFGDVEVKVDVFGIEKAVKDVVEHRAILISDEAVSWVDTEVFKTAEAEDFRRARGASTRLPDPTVRRLAADIDRTASMRWISALGKDAVEVKLPRGLTLLSPTFRLAVADTQLSPARSEIEGDTITLRFDGVHNFDDVNLARPDLSLLVSGPGAAIDVAWSPSGPDSFAIVGASAAR